MSLLAPTLKAAIGIATRGRAEILKETLRELRSQTRRPDRVIVCYTTPDDIAGLDGCAGIEFITAAPGLPRQRTAFSILSPTATFCCSLTMIFSPRRAISKPRCWHLVRIPTSSAAPVSSCRTEPGGQASRRNRPD